MKKKMGNTKNKIKNEYLIFVGSSGGIIEALERGSKVIQICEYPLFDVYSKKIWPSIKSKKLSDNIFLFPFESLSFL